MVCCVSNILEIFKHNIARKMNVVVDVKTLNSSIIRPSLFPLGKYVVFQNSSWGFEPHIK
jgi:hypothetical protein